MLAQNDTPLRPAPSACPHRAAPRPDTVLARSTIELVWNAPAEPVAARFFVEVLRNAAGGAMDRVFASYADLSAQQVPLEAPGQYAWRVSVVALDQPHYVASAWTSFTVQSGQGVASEVYHE